MRNRTTTWYGSSPRDCAFVAGCSSQIWNAGDLAEWVKDRAAEEGCRRDSIVLDEWYRAGPEGNVWLGSCAKRDDTGEMTFGVDVDPEWRPSGG